MFFIILLIINNTGRNLVPSTQEPRFGVVGPGGRLRHRIPVFVYPQAPSKSSWKERAFPRSVRLSQTGYTRGLVLPQ